MRRLAGRFLKRKGDDLFGDLGAERGNARGPRLVAQQTLIALLHEPLLPTPDAGFGFARPAHDLARADAIGAEQNDIGPPDVLLGGIAVVDQSQQPLAIRWRESEGDARAHAKDSHATR